MVLCPPARVAFYRCLVTRYVRRRRASGVPYICSRALPRVLSPSSVEQSCMRRAVRYDASASGRWLGYKPKQPCNDVQFDPAPPIGSFLGFAEWPPSAFTAASWHYCLALGRVPPVDSWGLHLSLATYTYRLQSLDAAAAHNSRRNCGSAALSSLQLASTRTAAVAGGAKSSLGSTD